MPVFRIDLTTRADVSMVIEVVADSIESAKISALDVARNGNGVWKYQGANTEEISVTSATEVQR